MAHRLWDRMAAVQGKAKPVRNDPPHRHYDAMEIAGLLANGDPNRHYVYVNKISQESLWEYEALGYEVESYRKNGVRPAAVIPSRAAKLDGQEIETRGMVLMSVDASIKQQVDDAGFAAYDKRLDRIRQQSYADEAKSGLPTRGASGEPMIDVVNETGPRGAG